MREFKVGEEFAIKVVEYDINNMPCAGCFFYYDDIACVGNCSANERSDHKDVIFKQVKMNKEKIKSAIKRTIRYMNGNYYSKFEEKMIVDYLEGALKELEDEQ